MQYGAELLELMNYKFTISKIICSMSYRRIWSRKIHPKNQAEMWGLKKIGVEIKNTIAKINRGMDLAENESVS